MKKSAKNTFPGQSGAYKARRCLLRWAPCLVLCLALFARSGVCAEFTEEVEHDFPLRSVGKVQVTNMRGDIVIQGWALDKIRVKAIKKAVAETQEEASRLFNALGLRYHPHRKDVELMAEYGKGMEISERLKERENPKTSMTMVISAPANLVLRVWTLNGNVTVKAWSDNLEVRTSTGHINIESVKAETVSLLCPSCTMQVKGVQGTVRVLGGSGEVALNQVIGPQVYVESGSGAINAERVRGDQLYVSKAGSVSGKDLSGHLEFHTRQGSVTLVGGSGFLSGRTETGDIQAQMKDWEFSDKALVESVRGSITLGLPESFSGDVDVWSFSGKAEVGFSVKKTADNKAYGPEPANRILGRIGDGGEILKIFSEKGDVRLIRGGS